MNTQARRSLRFGTLAAAAVALAGCAGPLPHATFTSECPHNVLVLVGSIPVELVGRDFDPEFYRGDELTRVFAPGESLDLYSPIGPGAFEVIVFSATDSQVYWWGEGVDGREDFVLSGDACLVAP